MKLFEKFNWFGYRRKNNKFGIRNYNIVLSTVALTDRISQEIINSNQKINSLAKGLFNKELSTDIDIAVQREREFSKEAIK